VIIKRVLDIGAYGVLVPWVNSREEAEKAVAACRYPPEGIRGWGPRRASRGDPEYRATANSEILVAVQIETEEAIRNIDEIAAVDGVDVLYVGPNDLCNNMGLGIPVKWENPRFLGALEAVLDACESHGKAAGLFCNKDNIQWAHRKGFTFNTVGDDDGFLKAGALEALQLSRGR
jgi:4-hydroxy-2-oxoheptanedioate aldolase